ncbi:hypothetical protein WR25_01832 [Diploscapter pachys]|uniref:Uncharacterized protein n=1 Tax=Diploscapter pachys TaxID=2018661 RepID=A0A2A2JD34_9BILA|nr:hypothetical protein WR25_01832 [Diploscapter pachys]
MPFLLSSSASQSVPFLFILSFSFRLLFFKNLLVKFSFDGSKFSKLHSFPVDLFLFEFARSFSSCNLFLSSSLDSDSFIFQMGDELLRLRAERDELNTKYEELLDEFRQVRKDVDSARAKMALQEETMEEYETEVKKEIDGLKEKCKTQEETIRQLNAKLQNQTCVSPEEMEELRSEKIALQEQLSAARGRIRELEEIANESICSSGFEPAANHEDLVKISQLEEEKNVALERATHFEARIGRLTAEMEDLQDTCNGLLNANRKLTDENKTHIDRLNEMEKQLSDALLPEQKHAKRGNSIYAEVSEGYDLLKEDLKKCFRDNQSLVRTNANLRRELAHEREKAIFAVNSTCSRQQNCDGCGELTLQLKIEQEKKRSTEKLYESLLKRNLTEMLAEVKKNPSQCLTQFAAELTQLKILVDSRFSTIDDLRLKLDDCTVINNQLKREKKNLEASLETAMKIQERLKTQCAVMQKRHEKEFGETNLVEIIIETNIFLDNTRF